MHECLTPRYADTVPATSLPKISPGNGLAASPGWLCYGMGHARILTGNNG
ncbi:hypothetical protein [Methanosarcina sp. 2.H.T.1A.3]|nr:hypothetical protein [Methanosarcina sp. 2.H.T.1A.3]